MIKLSQPMIGQAEIDAVQRVLLSGQLASGPEVEAFEHEFALAVSVGRATAVSSGTSALELGLRALGVGEGDEVILPSFTFIATANAVRMTGAEPVFADIDPKTFCISAATARAHLSGRTAAVIAVHLYGQPSPVDELARMCEDAGIALIEDAAQALGATSEGRPVGSLATLAAFSFYPTKNITTGEGGMVTTGDDAIADKVALLRNHGMRTRYQHEIFGTNARMTEIAAAIGRVQLGQLSGWIDARRAHASFYDRNLTNVETPYVAPGSEHAYHQYTIRSPERDTLLSSLGAAGVGCGIYYATPCHRQEPYVSYGAELPHTDRAAGEVLSIPVRPDLTNVEIERVAEAVSQGAAR